MPSLPPEIVYFSHIKHYVLINNIVCLSNVYTQKPLCLENHRPIYFSLSELSASYNLANDFCLTDKLSLIVRHFFQLISSLVRYILRSLRQHVQLKII